MNILVVGAHPDDEVLGLGGTLARHVKNGDVVFPVICADGSQVRYGEEQREKLKVACMNSCAELGLQSPEFLDFPDQRLDTFSQMELVQALETCVKKYQPEVVYTHHFGDINRDHQVLNEVTLVATRPKPGNKVLRVLSYMVPSSTDWAPYTFDRAFLPNWFVDISDTIDEKLRAVSHYSSEIPPYPHPRSLEAIRNQAKFWGSSIGFEYAEPFVLLRNLIGK
ncbi:MAG: PIG-L deacetylase family protein [Nitrospirales bacterium]